MAVTDKIVRKAWAGEGKLNNGENFYNGSSDEVFDSYIKQRENVVAANNPILNDTEEGGIKPRDYTINHFREYFNKFKECKFWLGSWNNKSAKDNDWRLRENNGLTQINPNVRLFTDVDNIELAYDNSFNDGGDVFPKAIGGVMDTISDALDAISILPGAPVPAARKISPFDSPKTWEKTSPIKFGSDITFNFNFGSAGLFSGYEEVVKPMYAIGALFAPGSPGSKGWTPPIPTKAQWAAIFLTGAFKTLIGGKDRFSPGEGGFTGVDHGLLTDISNAQALYFDAIHSGAIGVATHGGYGKGENRMAYFQFGHFLLGPCTVSSVSMTFDQNNLDDEGYPISGKLKLGGITTYLTAVREAIYGTVWDGFDKFIISTSSDNKQDVNKDNVDGSSDDEG